MNGATFQRITRLRDSVSEMVQDPDFGLRDLHLPGLSHAVARDARRAREQTNCQRVIPARKHAPKS